ncbi:fidgetin [Engraulis encrasicolus]|uniref:fidgetin n=1 Tax=Engraulis encrasicolus TaxID=184585 RepID=UPI002FD45AA6
MITSSSVYGLKMQWTPEHAQWAEQHFDISSTTRSPAHKAEAYRGHLQRTYQYAWANDDISALTASNLLKKYAEKYSGILEAPPGERGLLCTYAADGPAPAALLNGRKSEADWQDGIYPMSCAADVIAASKAGVTVEAAASVGSSAGSVTGGSLEPSYSSSNCGGGGAGGHAGQDFAAGYNGAAYLHSSYSGQSTPGLPSPHPSPLHSAGLLQPPPPPPPPPPPTLVPSYNAGSPNLSGYSYATAGYPPQTPVAGYSPGGGAPPPPPAAYLPSGIAAPTPLPPSTLPGYTYQSHSHAPIAPTPLNGSSANSLKRKAFYMTGQGDMDTSYGNFSYSQQQQQQQQQRSTQSPMYRMPDSSIADSSRGNGFDRNAEASSLAFKPTKQQQQQSMSSDQQQQRKFSGQSAGSRALTPPSSGYGSGGKSFGSGGKFADEHRQQHPEEQLKNSDASLVELVTSEVLQQGMPPVDWSDIAGLDMAKATLKDEVLWPLLRPDMFSGLGAGPLPRTVLLFGPQGSGRTLLARCVASQMGAAFLHLSGQALASKWAAEGDKLVQASFLVARCRQPAVLFISEVELLLSSSGGLAEDSPVQRVRSELLLQLDGLLAAAPDEQVLVVCSTSKPEEIDEPLRRYFMRRLLVPLPDPGARHQIISQLLSQHSYCLSDKEVGLLVQRTEGFSGLDVARLCQEAVIGQLQQQHGMAGSDFQQVRPVSYQDFDTVFCKIQPSISQKELDTYTEWNKMFGCCQ